MSKQGEKRIGSKHMESEICPSSFLGNTRTNKKRFLNISEQLDFSWNVKFFKGFLLNF